MLCMIWVSFKAEKVHLPIQTAFEESLHFGTPGSNRLLRLISVAFIRPPEWITNQSVSTKHGHRCYIPSLMSPYKCNISRRTIYNQSIIFYEHVTTIVYTTWNITGHVKKKFDYSCFLVSLISLKYFSGLFFRLWLNWIYTYVFIQKN